jgi:predicted flap endonuclease-1-like 5' DNA nuclease
MFSCRNICWIAGALLGLVVFLMLDSGWFLALLIGAVLAVAVALLLQRVFCAGSDAAVSGVSGGAARPSAPAKPSPAAAPAATAKPEAKADKPKAAPAAKPVAAAPSAPPKPAVTEPEAAAPGEGDKPALLKKPKGAADDLKLIKGVGPKLEEKLNALGVWHFSQIAAWSAAEVAWVDDQLSFRGRIERDEWISQAKTLAAGGETEFSARNK